MQKYCDVEGRAVACRGLMFVKMQDRHKHKHKHTQFRKDQPQ